MSLLTETVRQVASEPLQQRPPHSGLEAAPRYDAQQLFGSRSVVLIRHAEQDYVLRLTRNGKLILTK